MATESELLSPRAAPSGPPVRAAMIGTGGMARHHLKQILKQQDTTALRVVCEPSPAAFAAFSQLFVEAGLKPPHNEPDLEKLLATYQGQLDAAFIITPHVLHSQQAQMCLEAGVDVLLEKPMVMNGEEAEALIRTRDRTARLLVVAFNGSLSPEIRQAVALLRAGDLGPIMSIHAVVWQNWKRITTGTWRQEPVMSGGGFLFDTGAHMLNTIADLAGESFVEVAAWLDNRGTRVDILGAVMARLESGALVTLSGCGDAITSCASDVRVFCTKAILRTDVWGKFLEIQHEGETLLSPVPVPASLGAWETFLKIRSGQIPNSSPPEVGLRMARLWDAIQASARQNGVPVHCT